MIFRITEHIPAFTKRLFFTTVFFLSITSITLAQYGQLEGIVTEQGSSKALTGINVGLLNTTLGAATDVNGQYLITEIPTGTYTVRISGIGYKQVEREVTIADGTTTLSVELEKDILGMNEVVVSATRSVETLDEVPASVEILSSQEINEGMIINSDLSDILAMQVPGFSQATESSSNWGQNMRGRDYLVLINGIPQSTPLRAASRDLQTIDAGIVSRVEVVKGATAIYGNGATGGLINYITLLPRKNGFQSITKVGSNVSLADPDNSMGYRFSQQLLGRNNGFSYHISGTFEEKGLYKDATGDIIPTNPHGQGGLSGASIYNLFGQFGYDINAKQNIQLMYNFYSNDQETNYVTVPGVYPEQKATAVEGEVPGVPQGTRGNHNARIKYTWLDFVGKTSLDATAYLQDYETVFGYLPSFYRGGGQSYIESQKYGFRLNLESPFALSENIQGSVVYGLDLLSDNTSQKLIDGRTYVPEMEMDSYAPYAQLKAVFYDNWVLKGGLRYEDININVPDYTTVELENASGGGVDIEGGSLNYHAFTYNVGLSYKKYSSFNPFISVSQGFSIADLGRTLRGATEATTVQRIDPEPVIVQNYELGFNTSFDVFRGSVAGFVSTSDLGASYQENAAGDLVIARSPEIVYGFEVSAQLRPIPQLGIGGSYSLTEGRSDVDDNGSYTDPSDEFLTNTRISPPKFTAYVDYQVTSKLNVKMSMLYSDERERFLPLPSGRYTAYKNNVNAYTVFDLSTSYRLPFGSFSLGIENLFNADYYPAISQWAGSAFGTGYSKAPGARLNATLKIQL